MAEHLTVSKESNRQQKYEELIPQIEALLTGETDLVANLANVAAALWMTFGYFWVGFYLVKEDQLVLGPFQGPIACTRFPLTKGVCGASATQQETIIVPDVDQFPGHIACSSESKSEIVVPLVVDGKTKLVLDVDSDQLNDFNDLDKLYLEQIIAIVEKENY